MMTDPSPPRKKKKNNWNHIPRRHYPTTSAGIAGFMNPLASSNALIKDATNGFAMILLFVAAILCTI